MRPPMRSRRPRAGAPGERIVGNDASVSSLEQRDKTFSAATPSLMRWSSGPVGNSTTITRVLSVSRNGWSVSSRPRSTSGTRRPRCVKIPLMNSGMRGIGRAVTRGSTSITRRDSIA